MHKSKRNKWKQKINYCLNAEETKSNKKDKISKTTERKPEQIKGCMHLAHTQLSKSMLIWVWVHAYDFVKSKINVQLITKIKIRAQTISKSANALQFP